jgi:hypothetical protein
MHKFPVRAVHWHPKLDVGWLDVALPASVLCIPIATSGVYFDSTVFCWDYSPARPTPFSSGTQNLIADAWAHRGNVVRAYLQDGVEHINLSFPTMQGASGSPVLASIDGTFAAVGMVVGNLEQHLSPSILAQRVTVTDGDSFSETVSYFLPYGTAIAGRVLLEAVSTFCSPMIVAPASPVK